MKTLYAILLTSIFVLAGCNSDKVNLFLAQSSRDKNRRQAHHRAPEQER